MPHSYNVPSPRLQRRSAPLLIALLLTGALCVFFVYQVLQLRESVAELRRNDLERIEIRNVLVDLLDAETGQRGFILTGEESYLEPFYHGRQRLNQSLKAIERLSEDDATLNAWVAQVGLIAYRKLQELERTILVKKRGDHDGALAVVRAGFGKAQMDEARRLIQSKLAEFRTSRDDIMEQIGERFLRAAIVLLLMLTMIVALAVYAWRSLISVAKNNNVLARRLAQEASHDGLTGLPNRRFFSVWANKLIAKNKRESAPFVLMMLDLDGFKKVNDTYGHAEGDTVLEEVTARFQTVLRAGELLARLGGDEFAIILEGPIPSDAVHRLGRRLIDSLANSLTPRLPSGAISASIGVAVFPEHGADLESLCNAADKALYSSKAAGRRIVSFATAPARSD